MDEFLLRRHDGGQHAVQGRVAFIVWQVVGTEANPAFHLFDFPGLMIPVRMHNALSLVKTLNNVRVMIKALDSVV